MHVEISLRWSSSRQLEVVVQLLLEACGLLGRPDAEVASCSKYNVNLAAGEKLEI